MVPVETQRPYRSTSNPTTPSATPSTGDGRTREQESLPMGARNFKTIEEVRDKIKSCLRTGCGSNDVKEIEILNDL